VAKIKAALSNNKTSVAYAIRHNLAVDRPRGFEVPIVRMLHFWEMYAAEHRSRWEAPIGEDYVLGPAWQRQGEAIRELLNGETGALDCGTLDAFILDTMRENGFTTLSDGVEKL
jgi:hypothetical protein